MQSCKALQDHIATTAREARKSIQDWEDGIKERDLAEKRRLAPGWLDREEKLLRPTVVGNTEDLLSDHTNSTITAPAMSPNREGEELDRAFDALGMK